MSSEALRAAWPPMDLFVARQPIFDAKLQVLAYELLFRSGLDRNAFDASADENTATLKVIAASFFSHEAEQILCGRPAFINLPRRMLVEDLVSVLPKKSAVLEILEHVEPDAEIVNVCRALKQRGYSLALDDFVLQEERHPLGEIADYIKVDLRLNSPSDWREICRQYGLHTQLLAEKVETREEFEQAKELGFRYFQGYFFARPVILVSRQIPGFKLNYLRLLNEIYRSELDFARITRIIRREPALTYRLLRYVNSAAFTSSRRIENITAALAYIGERNIRRWVTIAAMLDLSSDSPTEVVAGALIRGRFCELLAPAAGLADDDQEVFLLGMFSRLDAMLGHPLGEVLPGLGLRNDLADILLGKPPSGSRIGTLWALVQSYEKGDWPPVLEAAAHLGIEPAAVGSAYTEAVRWSDTVHKA